MSDFTAVDALILQIANEVVKKGVTKTKVANVLTMLRDHIAEVELTPGQNALLRVEGTMLQWKLSDALTWTNLYDLALLEGEDGDPGPYFAFRVFEGVIQIRLSNAAPGDPWMNLVYFEDITGPPGSPDTATQIRDKINTLTGEDRLAVAVLKDFVAEVLAQIGAEVPAINDNQVVNNAGVADILSIYDKSTVSNITFQKSAEHGSETLPIYHFLTMSITGARNKNQVIVYHCAILVPSILVPNKPSSLRGIYVNQAAMTAAFADQTSGQHYYYTGSTSAWLYNGTATDSIANYTEIVAVAGWQEWGSKPAYLTVIGDAYLVGAANLNELVFTFHRFYNGVKNQVVCDITALTGKNEDPAPPDLNLLLHNNYNENVSPVLTDSVINRSIYGTIMDSNILGLVSDASYELVSGANYQLSLGNTGVNDDAGRAREEVVFPEDWERFFEGEEITVIWCGELMNTAATAATRMIFGNLIGTPTFSGFALTITTAFSMRMTLTELGVSSVDRNSTASIITENSGKWVLAMTFKKNSPTSNTVKFYRKSTANSVAFEQIGADINNATNRSIATGTNIFRLDKNTGSGLRGVKRDDLRVYNRVLTSAEISAIATILNP